ncbi:hypothetical protein [Tersicoccus sp. Bi-70]|uniref:hypothetical protein n=1 Tax=Tersicoccus sp. Bi-70 TaxID=1897634 RepID=UPI000976B626|nr:hypothetical protein [Tersicoccus sp. Bi-70]OMH36860.1 hypothetical protein BGP79_14005 [Tersicoccus sp. Bi-70]
MSASGRWAAYARDPESLNPIDRLGPVGLGVVALGLGAGWALLMTVGMGLLLTPRAGSTGGLVLTSCLGGLLYGVAMVAFLVRARRKARQADEDRRRLVRQLHQAWRDQRVPEQPLPGFRDEIAKTLRGSRLSVVLPVVLCLGVAGWFAIRASTAGDAVLALLGWVVVGVVVLGMVVSLHFTLRNRRRTADLLTQLDQRNDQCERMTP